MKSKSTAAGLAFFLGGIGAHKFYLEKPGQGLLYLLFCWTLLPAIIGALEGITYMSYSEEKWNQEFNRVVGDGSTSGQRKKCPDCAEFVMAEAKKCKHCGCRFTEAAA